MGAGFPLYFMIYSLYYTIIKNILRFIAWTQPNPARPHEPLSAKRLNSMTFYPIPRPARQPHYPIKSNTCFRYMGSFRQIRPGLSRAPRFMGSFRRNQQSPSRSPCARARFAGFALAAPAPPVHGVKCPKNGSAPAQSFFRTPQPVIPDKRQGRAEPGSPQAAGARSPGSRLRLDRNNDGGLVPPAFAKPASAGEGRWG